MNQSKRLADFAKSKTFFDGIKQATQSEPLVINGIEYEILGVSNNFDDATCITARRVEIPFAED
jgi:hypothetical protein